jgi:putative sterol carrier protein
VATFLSEEHMTAATEALNADRAFRDAMANVELRLQFVVTEGPAGDIDYYLTIGDGSATMALGTLEDADASVTSDYETATGISSGDLNVQMAFWNGRIKVGGNMAKVLMNQALINEFTRVSGAIDLEF